MRRADLFAVVVASAASFLVLHSESADCSNSTYTDDVTTSEDVQELRDALNCTGPKTLKITWNSLVEIKERIEVSDRKSLTVTGVDIRNQYGIDAGGTDGIFLVSDNSSLSLDHLLLSGGNATGIGGAVAIIDSTASVANCEFKNNSASISGGAISVTSSNVTLTGSNSFINNAAALNGGAFALSEQSTVSIEGIKAANNSAAARGGVFNVLRSHIFFKGDAKLIYNSAGSSGGAINGNNAEIIFQSTSNMSWNTAEDGGAIHANRSTISINGKAMFEGNSAELDGGAIKDEICTITISDFVNFTSNWARSGGAIVSAGTSTLNFLKGNVTFTNNSAMAGGGAMLITAPDDLDLSGSRFNGNKAEFGGAISLTSTKEETRDFNECYFEENEATDGGALYLYTGAGTAAVSKSIFFRNYARISGGAIFHTGSMTLDTCDFVSNEAGDEGLAVISIGLLETMANVTFTDNTVHCATGQYRNMSVKTVDHESRFDMACARCSTGSDIQEKDAEVADTNRTPVCLPLPFGANDSETGTTLEDINLLPGYYRIHNESVVVLECYHNEACIGGNTVHQYCAPGYKGPYCAVCMDNYAEGISYTCKECSEESRRSAVALGVFLVVSALVAMTVLLSYLGRGTDEWEEEDLAERSSWERVTLNCHDLLLKVFPLTAIKIVVVVWQIVSQFAAIAGNVYPQEYEDFLSRLSPINFDIGLLSSYSCMMTTDFYDRLLVATIAPVAVLGLLLCTYVIAKIRNRGSELALRRVQHKHLSAALFVAFFVYSSVSYTVFQTFVCDTLDDGNEYLRADYDVTCTTDKHKFFRLYATFMVCIYPVGIPAVFTFWLARNRRDLVKPGREDLLHLQHASDIWAAYKPSRFYYEVVECARRITLTGIAVFVLPNSPAQIAVVLLLAVVFLFVSESMAPFERNVDMGLYRWGNGIILASMYVALLLKVDVSNEESDTLSAFAAVLIAANICMILTVIVQSAILVKDWIIAKRRARMGIPGVPQAIPVFVMDVRSAGEEEEQCAWENAAYGVPIKRVSVVPEPEGSPRRPAPFKKQGCFRSSSQ